MPAPARHPLFAASLLFGIAALLLVATFGFFYWRDNFSTHFPIKAISAASFRAGELPYWNYYAGGGQPLAGNPNTLTFYPDNVFYLLLPAHVAFNLHFLLHLVAAWLAMRALTRSRFAAWLYVLSGMAFSAMAFYNLIVVFAMVPFAFWAVDIAPDAQRPFATRRVLALGLAFGLMALAGEPVTIVATTMAVAVLAFRRMRIAELASAIVVSLVIASPQLIAYSEIAHEVERGAHRYSAQTVLNASLSQLRFAELVIGPLVPRDSQLLFPSLLLGVIVVPALLRKSRYTLVAALMAFFALGRFNPIVNALVTSIDALRIGRYPEKFALPMCAALVVLIGDYFARTTKPRLWTLITFVPLLVSALLLAPIDRYGPYRVTPRPHERMFVLHVLPSSALPNRAEYRERARRLEPLFGALAGRRFALDRSPDGMYSILTRIATERWMSTQNLRWPRIAGCTQARSNAPSRAAIVPSVVGVHDVVEAVRRIESTTDDVGPMRLDGFTSPSDARVTRFIEHPQSLEVTTIASARAIVLVNETYFSAWVATANGRHLPTFPIDLDRLGVEVPAGTTTVTLRFGRHRTLVAAAWVISSLALLACALALRLRNRPQPVA